MRIITVQKLTQYVLLAAVVVHASSCRKKKSNDDESSDIEGLSTIPIVVSGDQPVAGNGTIVTGGDGGNVIVVGGDDATDVDVVGSSGKAKLVDLGDDQKAHSETVVKAKKISDLGTNPTYQWSQVSGPGSVTFADSAAVPTGVSADVDGTYVIRLTVTYADGRTGTDDINFIWDTTAPTVNVGADVAKKASFQQLAVTSDAAPFAAVALTHAWSKVSGPGTVTFTPSNDKDTQITIAQDGTYALRLTAVDSAGNVGTDDLTVVWDTTPPVVNAGANFITRVAVAIDATATDLAAVTYAWSKVSGPGTVTFGTPSGEDTTASVSQDGTYVLRLTATDAVGNVSHDDVQMIWDTADPVVNAGTDKTAKTSTSQDATVTDATALTYQWSQVSGPGTVTFGTATAQDTTLSADATGVYTIRLIATDAAGNSASDDMLLTWDSAAPSVDAGSDKVAASSTNLNATANDLTAMTYQWTKQSGPGTITFGTATAEDTTASASANGTYVLRLTVTDSLGNSAFDEVQLIWDTANPVVNAGTDKAVKTQVSQNATVTDATALTYQWSKISGPGTVTFGSATAEDTTLEADQSGVYTIRLTATDELSHSAADDMIMTWDETDPLVSAGSDSTSGSGITINATTSDLTAMTYLWTQESGPGTINFGAATAEDTTVSADQDGTYVLRLTVTDALGNSAFDEMSYTLDTNAATVDAGVDRITSSQVSQNAIVTGTGVGSSRVDLQACKLEYSIVSPK